MNIQKPSAPNTPIPPAPKPTPRSRPAILGLEVRYERSFLLDLQLLDPSTFRYIKRFVFDEFPKLAQLHTLPQFRQLGQSGIFYRFTLDRYLITLEMTGHLVKFLRVLPIPEL